MLTPERQSYDEVSNRELFLLQVENPAALSALRLPSRHFACLLIWDAEGQPVSAVSYVAEVLLDAGCSYLSAWGSDCERVHDIFDEEHALDPRDTPTDSVVMTTWHDDDSLSDALFYFLTCTFPADHFYETTRAGIVVVVGRHECLPEIERALVSPSNFLKSMEQEE